MGNSLTNSTKQIMRENAPWSQSATWWAILIQGLLLLGLGLYILFNPNAGPQTGRLLGIFLLLTSLIAAGRGLFGRIGPRALPFHMMGAGIGLAIGALVTLDIFQDFMSPTVALILISVGLLLNGLIGVAVWLLGGAKGRTWMALIMPLAMALLGLGILWTRLQFAEQALRWSGILATVVGLALSGYAAYLYTRRGQAHGGVEAAIDAGAERTQQRATAAATDVREVVQNADNAVEAAVDKTEQGVKSVFDVAEAGLPTATDDSRPTDS